jgi:hypothetical protein
MPEAWRGLDSARMAGGRAAVAGFPPFSLPNFVLFLSATTQGVFRCENFWGKVPVALFVVIWQKKI